MHRRATTFSALRWLGVAVRPSVLYPAHASLHLQRLWHAVFSFGGSASRVFDLHRRAAVRLSRCRGGCVRHSFTATSSLEVPGPTTRPAPIHSAACLQRAR